MKLIVQLARLFVGAMFVFSGFVKLVDPIGSQYKFEEYFSAGVLNLEFLSPFALQFSIFLIIAETLLGVMLLVGYKSKFTVRSLFVLTSVFLFLTWYSAYYNKVTDCGCFGDAIKLTPWETFYKNILLIVLVFVLILGVKHIKPLFSKSFAVAVSFVALIGFSFLTNYVLKHLPIIDFRPYAIGKSILEGMEYPDDPEALPLIHDFILEDTQNDLTQEILDMEKVMLVIVYNIDKSNLEGFSNIKEISDKALSKGYKVYGVSASFQEQLIITQNKYNLPFEFLFCDETTLKTMIRSNPGVMTMSKGSVTGKWSWRDVPNAEL